ncbi:MAG: N-acetylglutaminylglutamine amidotransferase [Azospirillum sp.]|nr:N-acetylglutaminylglutamine amidotransferase [Azospirillum sp.]
MCGICGEVRFDGRSVHPSTIAAMTEVMTPRGPDAGGQFQQGRIGLGHRRLMIIDLSQAAQQPMVDAELGLAIVFNGCIYNYKELRQSLSALGYRFFSHGDTEVLLKAYHAWGSRFVERLQGMFALAIWERDSGRVVLARDRLGIKPLYLAEVPGGLRFASTLPALVAGGEVDTAIDPVALHHYMSFHAVVPAPHTILNGVRKLPPATLLVLEPDGSRRQETYWTLSFGVRPEEAGWSGRDWQDAVLAALRLSVERRLVADVPVGVLLSGGLDSSLVVGLLAEAGQQGLKTFSIGFETVGNERGDEFQYSDLIARHYGTDHNKIFVDSRRALPALGECVKAMSEPMVSHDAIGFYLLSQEVSRQIRVVQSGQGADEIFGGYHWYPPMLESRDPVADYARVFCDRDHAEMAEVLDPAVLGGDHSREFVAAAFAMPGAERPIDQALRLDTTVMLVDDPVKRVDNMTMAWGLEARVPFLDHELVELAARVPAEHKIRDGGKYVLKQAGRQVVPAEVIDRPKGYFPVPALKYLQGPYLDLVTDILNQPAARQRGLFRRDYVDRLLKAPEAHITPLRGSKLWQIALLEYWLQSHAL